MFSFQCLLILAFICHVSATTCADCHVTYQNSRALPGKTKDEKCGFLKTYIGCLFSTITGCASSTDLINIIMTDYKQYSCVFSGVCLCQTSFYTTYPRPAGLDTICGLIYNQLQCPTTATAPSCNDGYANGEIYYRALLSSIDTNKCITSDTCDCEISLGHAQKNCFNYRSTLGCLSTATGSTCDGKNAKHELAVAVQNEVDTLACDEPSTACQCEMDAAVKTTTSHSAGCSTLKGLYDCLNDVNNENNTNLDCNGQDDSDDRAKEVRIDAGLNLCLWSLSNAMCINICIPLLALSLIVGNKLTT